MKYYQVTFTISLPAGSLLLGDARDVLAALAGEAGLESFEETAQGLTGYVQQTLFDQPLLASLLDEFPLPDCTVNFSVSEAEDRDWNEAWEQAGFEPICLDVPAEKGGGTLVVHDSHHAAPDVNQPVTDIVIDARLAFGTGTHETTRMMVASLAALDLGGKRILDCGTGTGILAIAALKLGAREAVGYDIDEWSTENARHNAALNGVGDRFTPLLGDVSILKEVEGQFDIVVANINRNILLADLPQIATKLNAGGRLLMSGFYASDIPLLAEKAGEQGLSVEATSQDGDWALVRAEKFGSSKL
ncbi:MAG: 50S ribosomal protein L11 methyltransferase [Prevotella sp.]|nr:50S ribosomal protein L11 methyltransferase [Prevotella sp.]